MKITALKFIEGTVVMIGLFWIVTNVPSVNQIVGAGGSALVGATKSLWGGGSNPMTSSSIR